MNQISERGLWWSEARFGMFIHWGMYAVAARHEWVQSREEIHPEKYARYQDYFTPDQFEPREWASLAKKAGMKYFVITAKHHDGYCMWDTKFSDYKVKRDYLGEVIEAFRDAGLKVGLYYSLIDWHHPDFVIDVNHPLRNAPNIDELNAPRKQKRYAKYMRDQVGELLGNYGKIDIIWFDFSYPREDGRGKGREDWESEKLLALARKLQPEILVDDRLDLPGSADFSSPEQYVPEYGIRDEEGKLLPWEGCQTFSGAWGYFRDELTWKTPRQVLTMLVKHVSRGGNLLMNIGPNARGSIDPRATSILRQVEAWMRDHQAAIYGCGAAPEEMPEPENCRYTYNAKTKRLYIHILSWPQKFLHLPKMQGKLSFARFLHDHSEIIMREEGAPHSNMSAKTSPDTVTLLMPAIAPDVEIPVVELFLRS